MPHNKSTTGDKTMGKPFGNAQGSASDFGSPKGKSSLPTISPGESEPLLRTLLEAIPDLVWFKDTDGVFLACNRAFEELLGAPESEIVGKTDYDFIEKNVADFYRSQDELAIQKGSPSTNEEWITVSETGKKVFVETIKTPIKGQHGELLGVLGIARDITDRKRAEQNLVNRISALTKPLSNDDEITFEDLFDIEDIQSLQDKFSDATGIASLITYPDGTPITKPSNFCSLCDLIRNSEKGLANCRKSDAILGRLKKDGPAVCACKSGGLWDAGAGISVDGKHLASWLIGQVRDETQTDESMRTYAREIGVDEEEVSVAFAKVPTMSRTHFERIANMLFTLANKLSETAYQNVLQARSISELERTKSELHSTRNYLSNVIDSMPSLVIGVDPQCRVTQWNTEARRVTGLEAKQAMGKNLDEVLPRLKESVRLVDEAIASHTAQTHLLHSNPQDKGANYESVTVYPLIANGVEGAVLRIDDITERVRMEQMMAQTEKMMSVGGLAAGMAHEINNPLAGVLGYTFNIKNRIFGDIPKNIEVAEQCGVSLEAVRDYLQQRDIPKMLDGIHESGSRAAAIVSNMLSFSRSSEHRLKTHRIEELLDSTIELSANDYNLKKLYDFRKIEIVREYEDDLPPVRCEGTEIQQVFLNLLKNGAEAMSEKAFDDGDEPRFICRIRHLDDMVFVEIEDNGPGISQETMKRVFEPFFTTKEVGKGTGLGLSVSYFIVTDQHGGSIAVDSSPGEWTRFNIGLPIRQPETDQAESAV